MELNVKLPCISVKSKCIIREKTHSICFDPQLPPSFARSALGVPSNCLEVTGQLTGQLHLKWPGDVKPTMWGSNVPTNIQTTDVLNPKMGEIWVDATSFSVTGNFQVKHVRFWGVQKKGAIFRWVFVSYWDHLSERFPHLKSPFVDNFGPFVWSKNQRWKGGIFTNLTRDLRDASCKKVYKDIFQPLISTEKKHLKATNEKQKQRKPTHTAAQKPHPMRASGWYRGLS